MLNTHTIKIITVKVISDIKPFRSFTISIINYFYVNVNFVPSVSALTLRQSPRFCTLFFNNDQIFRFESC